MDDDMLDMAMAMADFDDLQDEAAVLATSPGSRSATSSAAGELRRGPWTADEDALLANYVAAHGEGRWNALARSAGLRRTGKRCRLRWLNYLRPDVRRGNITAGEQLRILELHARWGNRWSKIAAHLPGRTDNEIKNYWRTRVQKHARHLRCHVNSPQFRHVVRSLWMPRLRERALADAAGCGAGVQAPPPAPAIATASAPPACCDDYFDGRHLLLQQQQGSGSAHHGVPAASEADHQYYSEPAGQTAAAAAAGTVLSPDDASSALRAPSSSLTADDASHYAAAYTSAATPTNDQGCGPTTTDDDVLSGTTWSELLATATATGGPDDVDDSSSMSMIGLPLPDSVGFGQDFVDGLWSLDDLYLQQLC